MRIFEIILACLLLVPSLYLLLLTCAAILLKAWGDEEPSCEPLEQTKIAAIIPAHNEALVIEQTLLDLAAISDDAIFIHVIADNCTDDTAEIARRALDPFKHRAIVWERHEPQARSKGQAIHWLITRLGEWAAAHSVELDYALILDADSKLSPGSFACARREFAKGRDALQSAYRLQPTKGLKAHLTALGFAAMNVVRGMGRNRLNLSDSIKGSGFWIRLKAVPNFFWESESLAEDFDYSLKLFFSGIPVHFLWKSLVLSTTASTKAGFKTQRIRWEKGRIAKIRKSAPKILSHLVRFPSANNWNLAFEFLTPPLGWLGAFGLAGWIAFRGAPAILFGVALLLLVFHLCATLSLAELPRQTIFYLPLAPFFVLWKMLLLPSILFSRGKQQWVRTPRD